MKKVLIYTDGACSGNPGPGGWAAIIKYNGIEKSMSGCAADTTNNRMELTAAIEGMKALKEQCEVDLYSDSSYLINPFKLGWIENWKANGWTNSKKESVPNKDLWIELDYLNKYHKVNWIKVKGHSDDEYNARCDKMAVSEIKNLKAQQTGCTDCHDEETVSRKCVYRGNIISVESLKVRLPGDKIAGRDVVLHPGAAVIIPITDENELFMVRQYRKPVEKSLLEIPAGKLDSGESPEVCARRELLEETGLVAGRLVYLTSIYTTPGFSNEVLHFFAAFDLQASEHKTDEDEYLSVEKHCIGELIGMVLNSGVRDAKSIIGILLAEKIIKGEIDKDGLLKSPNE